LEKDKIGSTPHTSNRRRECKENRGVKVKKEIKVCTWSLIPVISSTQEAEIGRRAILEQPRQEVIVTPYLNKKAKHGGTCLLFSYSRGMGRRITVWG
jgi:hypothetical protein